MELIEKHNKILEEYKINTFKLEEAQHFHSYLKPIVL